MPPFLPAFTSTSVGTSSSSSEGAGDRDDKEESSDDSSAEAITSASTWLGCRGVEVSRCSVLGPAGGWLGLSEGGSSCVEKR